MIIISRPMSNATAQTVLEMMFSWSAEDSHDILFRAYARTGQWTSLNDNGHLEARRTQNDYGGSMFELRLKIYPGRTAT